MHSSAKSTPRDQFGEPLGDEHLDRGLQARAEPLGAALELDRAGDDAAQIAQARPALAQRRVEPIGRDVGEQFEMDAAPRRVAMAGEPGFLGGEAEDRGEPAHEASKVRSSTVRTARRRMSSGASQ